MRISSLYGLTAELAHVIAIWPILTHFVRPTQGVGYTPVQSPDLDLNDLGRVALTGNFDSISLYSYKQQTESTFSADGSQSLITQLPNGAFANAANADGYIKALCPFVMHDGTNAGIIVGGNFTSLGGVQAQGVAMYDPKSGKITPLPGLTGQVNAVLCDQDTNTVYVGGSFKGENSTNAVAWVGMSGWANLPFEGFNGPVNSIVKSTNNTVIFGGSFTGLGNTTAPTKKDQQIINISSANISTSANTTQAGFIDPTNIVCKTNGQDGASNTWLLPDNQPGYWKADMNFGYEPSLFRIYNTRQDGRGTKTFRFTALPLGGIMNFTYNDPDTGKDELCDALCHLSANPSVPYQDFKFINTVGMSSFRIDISEWYGQGGGLDGVELFQDDIFAYAESDLNEPACANTSTPSNSTVTGPWEVTPSFMSNSRYLSADLSGPNVKSQNVSVVFKPDIKQKGNYSVTIYTPGCLQDNTCAKRGIVNVTGSYATSTVPGTSQATQIFQTNDYPKYDEIYRGPVDISEDGFRPTVTLSAMSGSSNLIVAQRVQFALTMNSTDGSLNGLYEFDPNAGSAVTDLSNSTIDAAGANLDSDAIITSIAINNGVTYVGGNFTDKAQGFKNIMSIGKGNSTSLLNGGLNDQVSTMYIDGNIVYVGGNFTNTHNSSVPGLNNIAAYDTSNPTWIALGAGVNGPITSIVPLTINVTLNHPEPCITFNGFFTQLLATGSNKNVSVQGFGVWVPSKRNWLQNLNLQSQSVTGQLSTATNIIGGAPLLAGTLASQDSTAEDAVSLTAGPIRLNSLNAGILPKTAGPVTRKRAASGQDVTGVVTGLFYNGNGQNITVLGGHMSAMAGNGSTVNNVVFLNSTTGTPTVGGLAAGVDADSTFLALATTTPGVLYAGGSVTGRYRDDEFKGLVLFDLGQNDFSYPQPPPLGGSNVVVNAISVRPKNTQVYVAGSFDTAGSLGCPAVCYYDGGVWNPPGSGINGVVNSMIWQGNDKLLVGGNLTIGNNVTTLANYDASKSVWSSIGAASTIPGFVTAIARANQEASTFWVAGKANNGSAFLMKYDGSSSFNAVGDVFGKDTTIQGVSVLNVNTNHDKSGLVDSGMIVLITGELNLPTFGNASAALYNGTTLTPFILSTSGNGPGSLSGLFSEAPVNFKTDGGHLAVGFIILIALACALGATFLLVVAGILIERYRRRQEGYKPAPTTYFDKTSNMGRIPPEQLFGRLGAGRQPPQI